MNRSAIVHEAPIYDRTAHLTFLERCILRHHPSTLLNQLPNKAFPPYDLIDGKTLQTLFETAFLQSGQIPTEISALYRLYFGPKSKVYASSNKSIRVKRPLR
ncbi:Hypothetical protein GLP15_2485 [Giardia lamblia P15]|uniref:Uncharacterized protein n=1 Tax=Giardia intestinalis (strain P15) TaxID=658858 RepID=E1EWI1_GIAIA|nr:Hypothetical protein GLP15_2485 [Giardia lamblia P15]